MTDDSSSRSPGEGERESQGESEEIGFTDLVRMFATQALM